MARTGRRPGDSGTRAAILDAARRAFAERGYDLASIRAVAEVAGVDPALVRHYFGSKEGLFVAAMELPVDPTELVRMLLAGDREHIGERIASRGGGRDRPQPAALRDRRPGRDGGQDLTGGKLSVDGSATTSWAAAPAGACLDDSALRATSSPMSRPACSLSSQRTSSRSQ